MYTIEIQALGKVFILPQRFAYSMAFVGSSFCNLFVDFQHLRMSLKSYSFYS